LIDHVGTGRQRGGGGIGPGGAVPLIRREVDDLQATITKALQDVSVVGFRSL